MSYMSVNSRRAHGRTVFLPLALKAFAGFATAVIAIALIAFLFHRSATEGEESAARVTQTRDVSGQLRKLLSAVKDAETGQRGYLLTGSDD
jgi:CHASE3 domain sensor protein